MMRYFGFLCVLMLGCASSVSEELELMWDAKGAPMSMDVLSDGRMVIAAGDQAFILDPGTGHRRMLNYPGHGHAYPWVVRVAPGDTVLVYDVVSGGTIYFFSADGNRVKEVTLEHYDAPISDLHYDPSPGGGFLALMAWGNIIRHYDTAGTWINTRGPKESPDRPYNGFIALTGRGMVVFPRVLHGDCDNCMDRPVLTYGDRGEITHEIPLSEDPAFAGVGMVVCIGAGGWEGSAYAFVKFLAPAGPDSVRIGHALACVDPVTGTYTLAASEDYKPISLEELNAPVLARVKEGDLYLLYADLTIEKVPLSSFELK